ncbi:MAG: hypothetical protein ACREBP_10215 [Sphingomicrobium sp.]
MTRLYPIAAALALVATPALAAPDYRINQPLAPAFAAPSYRIDPAFIKTQAAARQWEHAYLVLSAVDLAQTVYALESGRAVESNPLLGKHPSTLKLVAFKVVSGAARRITRCSPISTTATPRPRCASPRSASRPKAGW